MPSFEKNKFNYFLILIILFSYFFGFYIREISNGAGHIDLELHIWIIILDFKQNYFDTLKNYQSYSEATFPFFHSFQSFFNLTSNNYLYCLNNTIFNLFIIIIFYQFLKLKKIKFDNEFSIYLIPLILLISPWFRSSSYWGMTENFAFFFLIPSLFLLNFLVKKKITFNENLLLVVLISLTLYARQQYLFLAVFHILILLINNDKRNLIFSIILYFFLSLPGFYTLYLWGVLNDLSQSTSASGNLDIKNIFLNIPKISSLLFFYSLPLIFINFSKFSKIFLSKKYFSILISIFLLKLILFNDLNYPDKGGGYIVKFTQLFLFNNTIILLFISSIIFTLIISTISRSNYQYFLIVPLIYLNFGFTEFLYQEWFDPLYLIFFYIFFSKEQILDLRLNKNYTIKILLLWEIFILVIAFAYYHGIKKLPLFYYF